MPTAIQPASRAFSASSRRLPADGGTHPKPIREKWALRFILLAFLALCCINNIILPVFEASDEASHFRYAHFLATEKHLPNLSQNLPSHEATQPPLYYIGAALFIAPFNRDNLDEISQLNPDWFDENVNANYRSVANLHLHTPAENFPYTGAVCAVRAARLFSSLLGVGVLVFTYKLAVLFAPRVAPHFATFATALVAFNPKFIHLASIVSNDIAVTLASTIALWWLAHCLQHESFIASRKRTFILGAVCGIAVLCKLSGAALLLPATLFLWMGFRRFVVGTRTRRAALLSLPFFVVGFFVVTTGWFAFNQIQTGNPLAWQYIRHANAALLRTPPLALGEMVSRIPELFQTYWGVVAIEQHFPNWVNVVFYGLLVIAIAGWVVEVKRQKAEGKKVLSFYFLLFTYLLSLLIFFAAWLRSYVGTETSRLVLPSMAPIAIFTALGLLSAVPLFARKLFAAVVAGGMAALSLATPFWVIQPAFAEPTYLSAAQLSQLSPNPTNITFADEIKLVHIELSQRSVQPNGTVNATLIWGAAQPISQSYRVVLEAISLNGEVIGRSTTIPLGGRFSTQRWRTNRFFADSYAIPINPNAARGPAKITLNVLAQYPQPAALNINGTTNDTVVLGRVKVLGTLVAAPNNADLKQVNATFGNEIFLDDVRVTSDTLFLNWSVLNTPKTNYTLFVHVLDADHKLIAQHDAQPFAGEYATQLWDKGDLIAEPRPIRLDANAAQLVLGWYDATTGARLPALRQDGTRWRDDAVVVWQRQRSGD